MGLGTLVKIGTAMVVEAVAVGEGDEEDDMFKLEEVVAVVGVAVAVELVAERELVAVVDTLYGNN